MNPIDEINWLGMRRRWLAYLDILGFASLLEERGEIAATSVYEICLEEIHSHAKRYPSLSFAYFSDTFLIYAPDDSHESLGAIEQSTRWFYNILLLKRIPFRGALACDSFLGDQANNIFIGKALVEASRVGEKYNWIGLVLASTAVARLEELNLPANERLNYRRWEIPFKARGSDLQQTEQGFAYLIGASSPVNGKNQYIDLLTEMAAGINNPAVQVKYQNTIEFLKHFGVSCLILNSNERSVLSGSQSARAQSNN
jgi:hypothetical protein